jgi:hypothetical protein
LIPWHEPRFGLQDRTGITVEIKQDASGQAQEIALYTAGSAQVWSRKK